MSVRIGTAAGLIESGTRPTVAGPVRVFGDALIAGETTLLWRRGDTWAEVGTATGLRCAVDAPGGVLVGTDGAHLLRLGPGGFQQLAGFEQIDGRAEWHTPWGGPPEVRSLARTEDNVLFANVHVGGIARSDDGGRTWRPTVDIALDVHQVRAVWDRTDLVVAASAAGLLVSTDAGLTWRVHADGLDAGTYCRASAVTSSAILVSAAAGPRDRRSAIYRTDIAATAPFERTGDWIDATVDSHALDGFGDRAMFGTTGGEVWDSHDAGRTWSRVHQGLAPVTSLTLVDD